MPSVEELLSVAEVDANTRSTMDSRIEIDADTRIIRMMPQDELFGVESDEKSERKYFKVPKIVGNGVDLSKLQLRINYQNASKTPSGKDMYIVTDATVYNDEWVYFSWELSRKVTQYKGSIYFIVCAVKADSNGNITNEWNTTLAEGKVLEGLEVETSQEQQYQASDYLEQLKQQLLEYSKEIKDTFPSDYTQMQNDIGLLKGDLVNVSNESSQIILNNIYTNNIYISNWRAGGISSESGVETDNSGAVRSDFAKVLSGSYMYIEEVGYTNVVCICYWYNNDKNYIGSSSAVTNFDANVSRISNVIKVPDEAMYVRYVVADWSSTIKEPSFADNMVFGTMMKNLDKKDIVGNEVLNGTIKSDGYIRKVAVNIIDYSMKIIDHQFFKDDNGILQVAKNEGWAYYRDVSLYAGHSYVFVSSDEVTVTNLVYENNIELSRD